MLENLEFVQRPVDGLGKEQYFKQQRAVGSLRMVLHTQATWYLVSWVIGHVLDLGCPRDSELTQTIGWFTKLLAMRASFAWPRAVFVQHDRKLLMMMVCGVW